MSTSAGLPALAIAHGSSSVSAVRPADVRRWSHQAENWIDGEDLRTRFFPLRLVTTEQSLICTIRPAYADALIPLAERPQLFAPERLQIRPDNVFNRTPDRHVGLRRGARISFYVSNPEMNLRGSARLRELLVDSPEACLERYGEIGILQFSELNEIARQAQGEGPRTRLRLVHPNTRRD